MPAVGQFPAIALLQIVVTSDNIRREQVSRTTRPISWIKAARKDFEQFPHNAQLQCRLALTVAAEGGMPDIAKPMKGFGSGVFEIALPFRGDAFRVI